MKGARYVIFDGQNAEAERAYAACDWQLVWLRAGGTALQKATKTALVCNKAGLVMDSRFLPARLQLVPWFGFRKYMYKNTLRLIWE
jgi:hypothetical protein